MKKVRFWFLGTRVLYSLSDSQSTVGIWITGMFSIQLKKTKRLDLAWLNTMGLTVRKKNIFYGVIFYTINFEWFEFGMVWIVGKKAIRIPDKMSGFQMVVW